MTPSEFSYMMAIRIGLIFFALVGFVISIVTDGFLSKMGLSLTFVLIAVYLAFRIRWAAMLRKRKRANGK